MCQTISQDSVYCTCICKYVYMCIIYIYIIYYIYYIYIYIYIIYIRTTKTIVSQFAASVYEWDPQYRMIIGCQLTDFPLLDLCLLWDPIKGILKGFKRGLMGFTRFICLLLN